MRSVLPTYPSATTTTLTLSRIAFRSTIMAMTKPDLSILDDVTDGYSREIRSFWSSFPCPPPWRPTLLTELNFSRLGSNLTTHTVNTVKEFLVDKCELAGLKPGSKPGHGFGGSQSDVHFNVGSDHWLPTTSHPSKSKSTWCDTTCQLSIGCASVFLAMVVVLAVLIVFTRSRRPHKMTSTRPSRQQLQLSTSTSDAVNWAEFSNTEANLDDDLVCPPFRHRGLPAPPSHCRLNCDLKWNCPSCASCHPLMRMSPSYAPCSHGYSAVYETIDDDDEVDYDYNEAPEQDVGAGETTQQTYTSDVCQSCVPAPPRYPPNGHFAPEWATAAARESQEAETIFNGEGTQCFPSLPRYFELEQNCGNDFVPGMVQPRNDVSNKDIRQNRLSRDFAPVLNGTVCCAPHVSFLPNVVSMTSCSNNSERNGSVPSVSIFNIKPPPPPQNILHSCCPLPPANLVDPCVDSSNVSSTSHPNDGKTTSQSDQTSSPQSSYHPYPSRNNINITPSNSHHLFQPITDSNCLNSVRYPLRPTDCDDNTNTSADDSVGQCSDSNVYVNQSNEVDLQLHDLQLQQPPMTMAQHPDLLNTAMTCGILCSPTGSHDQFGDDNENEMPLRKPVLALHSQYFNNASAV